jgi:hypothetical protein
MPADGTIAAVKKGLRHVPMPGSAITGYPRLVAMRKGGSNGTPKITTPES